MEALANIGALIKVRMCGDPKTFRFSWSCECFFCSSGSNRVGLIIGPLPNNAYEVAFDTGVMEIHDHEFGSGHAWVIREAC